MDMESPLHHSNELVLEVYERLQHWRRRQRARWPGLFRQSLPFPPRSQNQNQSAPTSKMTVQLNRNKTCYVLINDVPIVICDGCACIQPLSSPSTSSDSTLPPPRAVIDPPVEGLRCDVCAFVTTLGPVRRILRLPACGPCFDVNMAFALLVEAVGAPHAIKSCPDEHRSWFLDADCRKFGLDALLQMLGLSDEQVYRESLQSVQPTRFSTAREYAIETEKFIDSYDPHADVPSIPFSVRELLPAHNFSSHRATAADRSAHLVDQAHHLWKTQLSSSDRKMNDRTLSKFQALSIEFRREIDEARLHNHIDCIVPPTSFHATQSKAASEAAPSLIT